MQCSKAAGWRLPMTAWCLEDVRTTDSCISRQKKFLNCFTRSITHITSFSRYTLDYKRIKPPASTCQFALYKFNFTSILLDLESTKLRSSSNLSIRKLNSLTHVPLFFILIVRLYIYLISYYLLRKIYYFIYFFIFKFE